ncbi:hypothetical protein SUDANB180_07486 [Streptomyces sp. enrichment culture]
MTTAPDPHTLLALADSAATAGLTDTGLAINF